MKVGRGLKEMELRERREELSVYNKNPDYIYGLCKRPELEARKAERGVGRGS